MSRGYVKFTAEKLDKREKRIKLVSKLLIILILFILFLFAILSLVYQGGNFTITLDPQFSLKSGLKMYDNAELKDDKIKLYANEIDFMDNISIDWLPNNLHEHSGGTNNGENYISYTFFIENNGLQAVNYWYEVEIVDVIRNVDEAVRFMIYQNETKTVYAKMNALTNREEEGTKAFYNEKKAVLEQRKAIMPNEIDKYTIVMWIEGDDPDCLDNLIGGELKVKVRIIESYFEENKS